MRKGIFFALVLMLALVFPSMAQAQSAVTLEFLNAQFWPEFDQPSVLVIYDFKLASDVSLPAQISLRVPVDAKILAVAQDPGNGNGLLTVPYDLSTSSEWQTVVMEISASSIYRIEYYAPYERTGDQRQYAYVWPGDYAVKSLGLLIQQPVDGTGMKTTPTLNNIGVGNYNLTYFSGEASDLAVGQEYSLEFSYNKTTDTLSASSVAVEPAGNSDTLGNGTSQNALTNYLPWILGGLGVLLIFGGVIWYWQSGQESDSPRKQRRRNSRLRDEDDSGDGQTYCAQCGKRAQPSDRFCRACGAKIRSQE